MESAREDNPEICVVTVDDLSRGGSGVARTASGQVVFIPWTAPGDQVKVRLTKIKKRYAHAELLEILKPSPIREIPRCPVFGTCGGCQWQHIPYALQWKTKSEGVRQALGRVGVSAPSWVEIPAERVWEYRNRIQLRGSGHQLGFFQAGSHQVVPVDRCDIARKELNETWEETRVEGQKLNQPFKVEVEVLPDGKIRRVWNSRHGAAGFRQVHDDQNEKMVRWVSERLTGGQILLDLFGGSGNFSKALEEKMEQIHCVDVTTPQSQSRKIYFHKSPVAKWLKQKAKNILQKNINQNSPVAAIVDPPREGLSSELPEIATELANLKVNELITIGCDPDAWAKDLSRWTERGWKIQEVMVIDLFPQTSHIESLAFLRSIS